MAEKVRSGVDKVESNVKDRVSETRRFAKKEIDVAKSFIDNILDLKPVKAVVDLTVGTLENTGDMLKKHGEITRRWLGGLK